MPARCKTGRRNDGWHSSSASAAESAAPSRRSWNRGSRRRRGHARLRRRHPRAARDRWLGTRTRRLRNGLLRTRPLTGTTGSTGTAGSIRRHHHVAGWIAVIRAAVIAASIIKGGPHRNTRAAAVTVGGAAGQQRSREHAGEVDGPGAHVSYLALHLRPIPSAPAGRQPDRRSRRSCPPARPGPAAR